MGANVCARPTPSSRSSCGSCAAATQQSEEIYMAAVWLPAENRGYVDNISVRRVDMEELPRYV